jgi:hypothetical protein
MGDWKEMRETAGEFKSKKLMQQIKRLPAEFSTRFTLLNIYIILDTFIFMPVSICLKFLISYKEIFHHMIEASIKQAKYLLKEEVHQ